ncbi:L-histidine N(alpha)-methyltransferase (plasmid) [Streptomyces sp. NBC_00015]|uniref:L-histidine N(alpha)-methyltransferase n=1 Tax=Streptomyces sp. NBC_00015 TaxID=2903611 RepID=UPI002F912B93
MSTPADAALTAPTQFRTELRADVTRGLSASPKQLPPRWLYDALGSDLFLKITELPEYYPTRSERAILTQRAAAIADITGARTLIELGSGSSDKTRLLLNALEERHNQITYAPVDISASAMKQAVAALSADYPDLTMTPLVADFTTSLTLPPLPGPRLLAFLGGTFGNLLPDERAVFLRSTRSRLAPGDRILLGVDLVKDPDRLRAAYDDAAGVTAAFNLNVLTMLNRELRADFDPDAFEHVAVWDPHHEWIEMRLRSRREQTVTLDDLGLHVSFASGEYLRTEISSKFRPRRLASELSAAGLHVTNWWTDPDGLYGLALVARDDDLTPPR